MRFKHSISLSALLGALVFCPAVHADFLTISQPTSAYTSSTTLVGFTDPDYTLVGALFSGQQVLIYNDLLEERTVPVNWGHWGQPPAVENATPRVGYTNGSSSLQIGFAQPVSTFGFELEPNDGSRVPVTAQFFSGSSLAGVVTLSPNSNAGALLFAASSFSNPFTGIVITDQSGGDFAIANQRYSLVTPEPSTLGLLLLPAALCIVAKLRRRKPVAF